MWATIELPCGAISILLAIHPNRSRTTILGDNIPGGVGCHHEGRTRDRRGAKINDQWSAAIWLDNHYSQIVASGSKSGRGIDLSSHLQPIRIETTLPAHQFAVQIDGCHRGDGYFQLSFDYCF